MTEQAGRPDAPLTARAQDAGNDGASPLDGCIACAQPITRTVLASIRSKSIAAPSPGPS